MPIARTAGVTDQPKVVKEEVERILVSTPPEVDRGLWEMMEIYGKDCSDPDTQEKVKFISDSLGEHPKDSLLHILTEIGQTPVGETKLGRIYKYLRLQEQSNKMIKQNEIIKSELESIKTEIKSNWRTNQWD